MHSTKNYLFCKVYCLINIRGICSCTCIHVENVNICFYYLHWLQLFQQPQIYYLMKTLVQTPCQQMFVSGRIKNMHLVKHCLGKVVSSYVCPNRPKRNRFIFSIQCTCSKSCAPETSRCQAVLLELLCQPVRHNFAKVTTLGCEKSVYLGKWR